MTNRRKKLSEDIAKRVFKTLLERFGEPIVDPQQSVGIRDEGPKGKKTYKDSAVDGPWNRPGVVKESDCDGVTCEGCPSCSSDMNESESQPGESDGYCDKCDNRSNHLREPYPGEPPVCPTCMTKRFAN